MTIHPSSFIDPSAKIAEGAVIGPFAVIGPNVTIGKGSRIYPHAYLENCELGDNCRVYPQASLGLEPQHLNDAGEGTRVVVGSNNIFREGVTVHRGTRLDKGLTRIGNDNYFMALSHVAHDCVIGSKVIIANGAQLAGHVEIGDHVFISSMVGLHQFVRVGSGALVSGGAMVSLDVAPYCIAQGDRASLKGLNIVGLRRMGFSRDAIKKIKKAYAVVFQSNLTLAESLRHPALLNGDPSVGLFRSFLSAPKRGFVRPKFVGRSEIVEPVG